MRKVPEKFCPKCGADITDSAPLCDDGGWYCDACELPVEDESVNDGW